MSDSITPLATSASPPERKEGRRRQRRGGEGRRGEGRGEEQERRWGREGGREGGRVEGSHDLFPSCYLTNTLTGFVGG